MDPPVTTGQHLEALTALEVSQANSAALVLVKPFGSHVSQETSDHRAVDDVLVVVARQPATQGKVLVLNTEDNYPRKRN